MASHGPSFLGRGTPGRRGPPHRLQRGTESFTGHVRLQLPRTFFYGYYLASSHLSKQARNFRSTKTPAFISAISVSEIAGCQARQGASAGLPHARLLMACTQDSRSHITAYKNKTPRVCFSGHSSSSSSSSSFFFFLLFSAIRRNATAILYSRHARQHTCACAKS